VQYWLSILPFGRMIRESLERFCCSGGGLRELRRGAKYEEVDPTTGQPLDEAAPAAYAAYAARGAAPADSSVSVPSASDAHDSTIGGNEVRGEQASTKRMKLQDFSPSDFFRPSVRTMNQGAALSELTQQFMSTSRSMNAETLLSGMLGIDGDDGTTSFSNVQRENLAQFFVLDQMAKPVMRAMMPASIKGGENAVDLGALLSLFVGGNAEVATSAAPDASASRKSTGGTPTTPGTSSAPSATSKPSATTTDDLRAELDELRAMVKRQQATIDQLAGVEKKGTSKRRPGPSK
jgi:hypothetical protein